MAYTKVEYGVNQETGEATETVVYGASGLGSCSVALYYDRQGVTPEPPPQWLQEAYNQGNENEGLILDMFQQATPFRLLDLGDVVGYGYSLGEYDEDRGVDYSNQVRVEAKVLPGVVVRAHLDGIAELTVPESGWIRDQDTTGKKFVVEVKALGDTLWQAWKARGINIISSYPWQVTAQMKGAGLPCIFVVGHKDKNGRVFEIDYKIIDEPPIKWMEVIKKIGAIEKEQVEDCPLPMMYPCPYYPLHNPENTRKDVVVLDDTNTDQTERLLLISLGEEYQRHLAAEKHHKELKAKASAEVAKWFDEHRMKGGTVKAGAWQITDIVQDKAGAIDFEKLMPMLGDVEVPHKPRYEVRYPGVTKIETPKDTT